MLDLKAVLPTKCMTAKASCIMIRESLAEAPRGVCFLSLLQMTDVRGKGQWLNAFRTSIVLRSNPEQELGFGGPFSILNKVYGIVSTRNSCGSGAGLLPRTLKRIISEWKATVLDSVVRLYFACPYP
jgi:hypothetical protein